MTSRSNRALLVAALVIALIGGALGATVYAALRPSSTTTVSTGTTVEGTEPVSATTGLSVGVIYRIAEKGTVDIKVTTTTNSGFFGGSQTTGAEGAGFVYDSSGDIVTNEHVIAGANSIKVTLWNGSTYTGHVVGSDPSTDLAVVHVSAPKSVLHPLALADSDAVQVGDGVVAIGSPFGLAETATSGIVSALDRTMTSPDNFTIAGSIQTDAPINHGNSGGPLLNTQAKVIGIDAQIQSESGGSEGVGFAIPSNTVRSVVGQLIAPGHAVAHAFLGVGIQDSTTGVAGAEVTSIQPGTPAANIGLGAGDVITEMGGQTISSVDDLTRVIAEHKPGDKIGLTYSRSGKRHTVTVKLTTRPAA